LKTIDTIAPETRTHDGACAPVVADGPRSDSNPIVKFLKQSSHYLTGNLLTIVAGFISLPVLTRFLSVAEYGTLSLIFVTLWIALALAKGGLQEAAVRFYSEFKSGIRPDFSSYYNTIFWGSLILVLIVAFLFWVLGSLFQQYISETDTVTIVPLVAGLIISGAVFQRLNNFLRAEQSTKLYNLFVVLQRYAVLALGIPFMLFFSKPMAGFLSGSVVAETALIAALLWILIGQNKIKAGGFSPAFFKECFLFGLPLVGYELTSFLVKIIDRYLLQFILGPESVGAYSLAFNLCAYAIETPLTAVWAAIQPIYLDLWHHRGKEPTAAFLSKVCNYALVVLAPVILGFAMLSREIIRLLATAKYESAAVIIPWLMLGILFWGFFPVCAAGNYITKNTPVLFWATLAALVLKVILSLILIPRMYLLGAAIATLVSYFFMMIFVVRSSFRHLKISLDYKLLGKAGLAGVAMFFVLSNLSAWSGLLPLLAKVLTGAITYAAVLFAIDTELRRGLVHFTHGRVIT
jgi:O-antigen/teichoic acid export membrane protein